MNESELDADSLESINNKTLFTVKLQPVRDYNKINYKDPVSFNLIINHEDPELLELLKEKINEWIELQSNEPLQILKENKSLKEQLRKYEVLDSSPKEIEIELNKFTYLKYRLTNIMNDIGYIHSTSFQIQLLIKNLLEEIYKNG